MWNGGYHHLRKTPIWRPWLTKTEPRAGKEENSRCFLYVKKMCEEKTQRPFKQWGNWEPKNRNQGMQILGHPHCRAASQGWPCFWGNTSHWRWHISQEKRAVKIFDWVKRKLYPDSEHNPGSTSQEKKKTADQVLAHRPTARYPVGTR